jgi:hypothetical protein
MPQAVAGMVETLFMFDDHEIKRNFQISLDACKGSLPLWLSP